MEIKTLSLSELLMLLEGGGTVEEIQQHIRAVSQRVLETGNQGSITIKLTFARNGSEGTRQLMVKDAVSYTMPKLPKGSTLFFATDEGNLTRQNPDQAPLAGMDR